MDSRLLEIIGAEDVNSLDALIAKDPLILDQAEMAPSSNTPLHIAALVGKTELVEAIIARKPNFVRQLNQAGLTPLHIASAMGNLDIVKVLLSQSSDLCMLKDKDGRTPLHHAAKKGRVEIIEELLSRCPQAIKERTAQRETALHLAMMNNQFDAVRLLVEKAGERDADELIRAEDDVWNKVFPLAVATNQPQDWTGLDFRNIMTEAGKIRSTGNRLFKEGRFELAKAKYEKVLHEFNHVSPQDDEEGKEFLNTKNFLHLNVAACHLKMGEPRKSIEACNKVLDANPAHVKALYRRGMAYMSVGDFEEARNDFKAMIKIDKSSEPDATAALSKLKQKEQEVERKARKQFKGLFDKKPGHIADAGTEDQEEQHDIIESKRSLDQKNLNANEAQETHEVADASTWTSWFSFFWPRGRRLFTALGLERCSIL